MIWSSIVFIFFLIGFRVGFSCPNGHWQWCTVYVKIQFALQQFINKHKWNVNLNMKKRRKYTPISFDCLWCATPAEKISNRIHVKGFIRNLLSINIPFLRTHNFIHFCFGVKFVERPTESSTRFQKYARALSHFSAHAPVSEIDYFN